MIDLQIFLERNPGKALLIVIVLMYSALYFTSEVETIEKIDGKDYVIAIDGKEIDPRPVNKYDLETRWVYVENK